MTSVRAKFRPSSISGREGTVYYQVIHNRRVRYISSTVRLLPTEWDERTGTINAVVPKPRKPFVTKARKTILHDITRLIRIADRLDKAGMPYSVEDITERYRHFIREYSLFTFIQNNIDIMRNNGNIRTSETYRAALNSIRKFLGGNDVVLDTVSPEMMEAYAADLRLRGLTPNTISFYTRILRAVYNRAAESGDFEHRHPFRRVYTGVGKTVKRALRLAEIRKIKALDLTSMPKTDYARDIFILSFYLRGMSFIDMAYLRKTDLRQGYISYRRRKTGQRLTIKWTAEMQAILNKYPHHSGEYLLPIISPDSTNTRSAYRNAGCAINRSLKTIAGMIGTDIPLTLYVARHSWASAAKSKGIPISVISEGMGHDSETTTQIYLASLDASVVDRANSIIIHSI